MGLGAAVNRSFLVLLVFLVAASPARAQSGGCGAGPPAGKTIAAAGAFTVGACGSGGGNDIDFWKLALVGGDRVQLTVPTSVATEFDLYPPEASDATFTQVRPLDVEVTSPASSSAQVLTLQAPYSGAFVLGVCEPSDYTTNHGDCRGIHTGRGRLYTVPMRSYTFSSMALGNACGSPPVRAAAMPAPAPALTLATCGSGGGNDTDFWDVSLNAGDGLQITVPPAAADIEFDLYSPGTTGATFTQVAPVDSEIADASQGGATPQVITLVAPDAGSYVLASCEPSTTARGDCRSIATGGGSDFRLPMKAYTFMTAIVAAPSFPDVGSSGCCDFGPYDPVQWGSTPTTTFGTLSVSTQTVRVSRKGGLKVAVKCSMSPCSGRLSLTATRTTGHSKSRKKTTIALASVKLSELDGGTTHVPLVLSKAGARLLAHAAGHVRATAALRYDTDTSTKTVHATITLRATLKS